MSEKPAARWSEPTAAGLQDGELPGQPWPLLHCWLSEAQSVVADEGLAMFLASVDAQGRPHARMLLLRGVDEHGLLFFSHYQSAKGQEFAGNPYAAAVFHWPALQRQLRIEGVVERLGALQSDQYYQTRPRASRLGAWASEQSQVLSGRGELEAQFALCKYRFLDREPPRPANWGGYRLLPQRMEFWQARPARLHDRHNYRLQDGQWLRERLAP